MVVGYWSPTHEAMDNLRANLQARDPKDLLAMVSEIATNKVLIARENLVRKLLGDPTVEETGESWDYFEVEIYERLEEYYATFSTYELVEIVADYAEELCESAGGGPAAYVTPYQSFTVPFTKETEE